LNRKSEIQKPNPALGATRSAKHMSDRTKINSAAELLACLLHLPQVAAMEQAKRFDEIELDGLAAIREQATKGVEKVVTAGIERMQAEHKRELEKEEE
jgi:hypothetical protein